MTVRPSQAVWRLLLESYIPSIQHLHNSAYRSALAQLAENPSSSSSSSSSEYRPRWQDRPSPWRRRDPSQYTEEEAQSWKPSSAPSQGSQNRQGGSRGFGLKGKSNENGNRNGNGQWNGNERRNSNRTPSKNFDAGSSARYGRRSGPSSQPLDRNGRNADGSSRPPRDFGPRQAKPVFADGAVMPDVVDEEDNGRSYTRGKFSRDSRDLRGFKGKEEGSSRSYRALESNEGFSISRGRPKGRAQGYERNNNNNHRSNRRGIDFSSSYSNERRKVSDKGKGKEVKVEKEVFIPSMVNVGRLADIFNVKIFDLQRRMMRLGISEDQRRSDYLLTAEEACNIALEYGLNPIVDDEKTFDILPEADVDDATIHPLRPPVVTIMGHVDHGKTTLLDSLRNSSVAPGEAGGITQHIGAFSVPLSSILSGSSPTSSDGTGSITFLDTPGHAAFTAMRARGASVTDLIVLVVAADDGVMPQTKEVIELWKSDQEKVGLVVAINKCDKPGVDFDKVKSALGAEGIILEEDGGDIPSVKVSGLTGMGLDSLVETLSTLAEIRDLRARQSGKAEGYVLESRVDKGRGNVATVLVTKGTLNTGSSIVAGTTWAKVRQMQDSSSSAIKSAIPGQPITLTGWKDLPSAGDQILEASNEEEAKKAISNRLRNLERKTVLVDVESINLKRAEERKRLEMEEKEVEKLKEMGKTEMEINHLKEIGALNIHGDVKEGQGENGKKELRLIIKGDVSGSVEAVIGSLEGIGNKEAGVKIIHTGVGEVGESDVQMAEASEATIIAFSVAVPRSVQSLAKSQSIPLHSESVIYRLIEKVRSDVIALLPPVLEKRVTGEAICQQVFEIKLKGIKEPMKIAGCKVTNGIMERKEGVGIRILRGKQRTEVYEGSMETLKHLKKEVSEVRKGTECGISFNGFSDVREGDEIVTFTTIEIPRQL